MGRRPTIDREAVLAAAEEIVASKGATALTIDAVAKAAGITKGGVQSCFGTKEAMINAMLERCLRIYEKNVHELVGDAPTPEKRIWAHAVVTLGEDHEGNELSASLMAALLHSPEHLQATRLWYDDLVAGLNEATPEHSRLRLAIAAVEGAFFLRYLGLMSINEQRWKLIRDDIESLLNR